MFQQFSKLVKNKFDQMSCNELFVVDLDGDVVWAAYLAAFPAGTNELFKERTIHDCNCCKQFIRNVATVVSLKDGKMSTVWDDAAVSAPYPYDEVSKVLAEMVRSAKVKSIFRKSESTYGAETTRSLGEGNAIVWNHFVARLKSNFITSNAPTLMSEANSAVAVFQRGLEEFTVAALEEVVSLIESNSIYRGTEFKSLVDEFLKMKRQYSKLNSDHARNMFVWNNYSSFAAKFRSTAIGTLVEDLSKGVDLEAAVRMFESKVAPQNYKRTSSLITPRMVADAQKTLADLGLESSIERRYAVFADMKVNNVLFVDNSVKPQMKGGIAGLLSSEVKSTSRTSDTNATPIDIESFMESVLPKANSIELLLKNTMSGNMMSLTAPVHDDAPDLFKWNNGFAWSYSGNITDSIKEKVKRAGGDVYAKLRASLNWFNTDDLDIHVIEPNGNEISFRNKEDKLDVDMNVSCPVRDAVENIRWKSPKDGVYTVYVNNFSRRESTDVGFNIQLESDGILHDFSYQRTVVGKVLVVRFEVSKGSIVKIVETGQHVTNSLTEQTVWGVNTEQFVKVQTVVFSPNYWDDNAIGNKHWFFILEGCNNPEPTRGFYNEFLRADLDKHRKVFEILGDKMKCQPTDNQMSGVGFSSTKHESVTVRVTSGNTKRQYKINF